MIVGEAVLTSTHNLCFGAKIRKIGIPLFCYINLGYIGVYITWTCFPDGVKILFGIIPLSHYNGVLHVIPPCSSGRLQEMRCKMIKMSKVRRPFFQEILNFP